MPDPSQTQAAPVRFLIVDDHAAFRQTLRAFLPAGSVAECDDSRDALSCYAALTPAWVLMDIEMPHLDGLSATRQLLAHYPRARVIIVSHHGDEEFRHAAREAGTCGFVHKAHLEDLRDVIDSAERS